MALSGINACWTRPSCWTLRLQVPSQGWVDEFAQQGPSTGWADEFAQSSLTTTASASQQQADGSALEQTRALAETLSKDADPKFQNSKFLQFISKMSRGEIILEDNQVCRKQDG